MGAEVPRYQLLGPCSIVVLPRKCPEGYRFFSSSQYVRILLEWEAFFGYEMSYILVDGRPFDNPAGVSVENEVPVRIEEFLPRCEGPHDVFVMSGSSNREGLRTAVNFWNSVLLDKISGHLTKLPPTSGWWPTFDRHQNLVYRTRRDLSDLRNMCHDLALLLPLLLGQGDPSAALLV